MIWTINIFSPSYKMITCCSAGKPADRGTTWRHSRSTRLGDRGQGQVLSDFIPNNLVYAECTWLLLLKSSESYKIIISFISFSCCPVTMSCPTLCELMDCSMPGFPILHYLLEFAQTHVHWVSDAIQPSHPVAPFSFSSRSFPASGSFPMSWLFVSKLQSVGASASAISPSNEYSGLISFRIDWFDFLAVQGTLKSSPAPQFISLNM